MERRPEDPKGLRTTPPSQHLVQSMKLPKVLFYDVGAHFPCAQQVVPLVQRATPSLLNFRQQHSKVEVQKQDPAECGTRGQYFTPFAPMMVARAEV